MIAIVLIAAAVLVLYGKQLADRARELWASAPVRSLDARHWIAIVLLAGGLASLLKPGEAEPPQPTPAPDAGPLDMRGVFSGPTAADDAATIAALCEELAAEIEWDGMQSQPMLRTGASLDELRRRARELRCRGVSIGDRQPRARDMIAAHLEQAVGEDGGMLTPTSRAAWVSALREIGRAAADATR